VSQNLGSTRRGGVEGRRELGAVEQGVGSRQGSTAERAMAAGRGEPMRGERLTLGRDDERCNGLYSNSEECRALSGLGRLRA
jgi:hypothetical protein